MKLPISLSFVVDLAAEQKKPSEHATKPRTVDASGFAYFDWDDAKGWTEICYRAEVLGKIGCLIVTEAPEEIYNLILVARVDIAEAEEIGRMNARGALPSPGGERSTPIFRGRKGRSE